MGSVVRGWLLVGDQRALASLPPQMRRDPLGELAFWIGVPSASEFQPGEWIASGDLLSPHNVYVCVDVPL